MARKKLTRSEARKHAADYVNYLITEHKLPVAGAYLFGSFGSGKTRDWSDIDVCVISPKFKRIDPLEYLWTRRRPVDVDRGIEPYGIAPKDFVDINPIAYQVKKTGHILK